MTKPSSAHHTSPNISRHQSRSNNNKSADEFRQEGQQHTYRQGSGRWAEVWIKSNECDKTVEHPDTDKIQRE
ncbi:hypothetical protein E5D57_005398 [Metarhizium anisopliae]|nr:hypothetical protein E5D57_005398 [Metarhizium anisopliae]